jgi:hypothetical protein
MTAALQKAAQDVRSGIEAKRLAALAAQAKRVAEAIERNKSTAKNPANKSSRSRSLVTAEAAPPTNFSPIGVTVRFFAEFREQHGVKLVARTTAEVCNDIIAPLTAESKLSYCELLHFKGDKSLGSATVLISHAWSCRFTDFLDAVLYHFRGRENEVLWIDVFSSNLHASPNDQLENALISDKLKSTLVVLTPLVDPAALKRTWCLWELSCAVIENHEIDIILTENDRIRFADAVISGRVRESLAVVDLKSSEASAAARAGIDTVSYQITEKLQDAVIKHTEKYLGDATLAQEISIQLKRELGHLYVVRHRYDDAESLFKECLTYRRFEQGDEHPDTKTAMSDLAQLYSLVEKPDMAAPLLEELFQ